MLTKGTIIKLKKEMPGINYMKIGDEFKVDKVYSNNVITITCRYGRGMMSYDEFQEYFYEVKPEPKKPVRVWSKWLEGNSIHLITENEEIKTEYRTNGKKVEIRTIEVENGRIKAESCCHKEDKFDIVAGLELAQARLKLKLLKMLF